MFKSRFLIVLGIVSALIIVGGVATYAQNPFNIQFPIPELGNCASFDECAVYCDDSTNIDACTAWAKGQGIDVRPHDEEREVEAGPGGCTNDRECRAYCDNPNNREECVRFAVDHGHMTQAEADRISRGGPGGCQSREACDAFCSQPTNLRACIDFGVQEGHISAEEAERFLEDAERRFNDDFGPRRGGPGIDGGPDIDEEKARQVLEELGVGPGGCEGFQACEAFCSEPANDQTCFNFAVEHGLVQGDVEKFKRIMEEGGPGGCRGRECEAYCEAPGRERECLDFAIEHGLIPSEEAERAKKHLQATANGGPGGCRGRECEAYCNDQSHREECFEFAKQNGLIPPEELERIEKMKGIEQKVRERGGPGGCRDEGECHAYCSNVAHFDECAAFAVSEGFLTPNEAQGSLRRFIEIEQFGSPGRPGGFGSEGFPGDPQGFGPGGPDFGEGDFPPGFENIPPEMRAKAEEQFKARFQQFEQFRGQFEEGRIPQPGDFMQDQRFREGFENEGDFRPMERPRDFPGGEQFQSQDFEKMREQFEREGHLAPFPGQFPGEGDFPPPGEFPVQGEFERRYDEGHVDGQNQPQFQNQYRQEFDQQQFNQQFNQQFDGNFLPSTDGNFIPSPDGNFAPPPDGSFVPPPPDGFDSNFIPPPEFHEEPPPPEPTGFLSSIKNFASIFFSFPTGS